MILTDWQQNLAHIINGSRNPTSKEYLTDINGQNMLTPHQNDKSKSNDQKMGQSERNDNSKHPDGRQIIKYMNKNQN